MKRLYEFPLPVNKQGEDFSNHIKNNENPRTALFSLAEQYELAADLCRQVARKASDDFSVECAEGHVIIIEDEENYMESLEEEEILFEVVSDSDVCDDCKKQMN